MVKIETLLEFLAMHGGSIISSNDLPPELINQARASGRIYIDNNSLGYIWEPPFASRFPTNEKELEMWDWCYPLPAEIPDGKTKEQFFEDMWNNIQKRIKQPDAGV